MGRTWKWAVLLACCAAHAGGARADGPSTGRVPLPPRQVRGGESLTVPAPSPAMVAALGAWGYEEWEVFLSLDGGRRFPIRLTPHLAADTPRATIRWPHLEASEARLLIRLGDERNELEFLLPEVFRIESPVLAVVPDSASVHGDSGDIPIAGTPKIVWWVVADVRGAGWKEVSAARQSVGDATPSLAADPDEGTAFEEADPHTPTPPAIVTAARDRALVRVVRRPAPDTAPSRASDRLSLLQRRNE